MILADILLWQENRVDLTALKVYTIDSDDTDEVLLVVLFLQFNSCNVTLCG